MRRLVSRFNIVRNVHDLALDPTVFRVRQLSDVESTCASGFLHDHDDLSDLGCLLRGQRHGCREVLESVWHELLLCRGLRLYVLARRSLTILFVLDEAVELGIQTLGPELVDRC